MGHCSASWQEKKKGHGKLRMALKGISGKSEWLNMCAALLELSWHLVISAHTAVLWVYRPLV